MNTHTGSMNYPPASRELEIPSALDALQTEIERIGKVSEELTVRLEKVASPLNATTNDPRVNPAEVSPVRAEYVDNLRNKTAKIRHVCEMLENILSRLEL